MKHNDAKKLLFVVPQGSVLGEIVFSLYTTPLRKVIQNYPGIGLQFYIYDMQLNPGKTEFIIFGSKLQREKLNKSFPVNILGNFLSPEGAVRNLDIRFDSDFSFSRHVQNIWKCCFAQIRDLMHLRGYLTCHAAFMAANALVGSRLM